jgi:hypothetical protein
MPDRVRHDWLKISAFLNCDTASEAGIQKIFGRKLWIFIPHSAETYYPRAWHVKHLNPEKSAPYK